MKQTVENIDFIPWLKKKRGRATVIYASIPLVISVILPILKWLKPSFLPMADNRSFWLNIIQVFFIGACFSYLYLIKRPIIFISPKDEAELIANNASDQFWHTWRMVWAGWLLLYIGLVIQSAYNSDLIIPRAATHVLNNLSSVALILCYSVLARITVNQQKNKTEESTKANKGRPKLQKTEEFLAILWLAFALIEIMAIELPDDQEGRKVLLGWFGLVSGCIGAVSMALLIGRLDSMLLGVPVLLIAALFLYSSIQPTFHEFVVTDKAKLIEQERSGGVHQQADKDKLREQQLRDFNDNLQQIRDKLQEQQLRDFISKLEKQQLEDNLQKQKIDVKLREQQLRDEMQEQLRDFIRTVLLVCALIGKVLFFVIMEWLDSSGRLMFYLVEARHQFEHIPVKRREYVKEELVERQ